MSDGPIIPITIVGRPPMEVYYVRRRGRLTRSVTLYNLAMCVVAGTREARLRRGGGGCSMPPAWLWAAVLVAYGHSLVRPGDLSKPTPRSSP